VITFPDADNLCDEFGYGSGYRNADGTLHGARGYGFGVGLIKGDGFGNGLSCYTEYADYDTYPIHLLIKFV
jgi:hypothetical protein